MIQPNELRLGNLLKYPLIGYSQIRDGSDIDNVFADVPEGIDLTPELLNQLGFKQNVLDGITGFDRSDPDEKTFYWEPIERARHVDYSLVMWGKNTPIYFSSNNLRVELKYVHQLQNLIFALTGQELKIVLK